MPRALISKLNFALPQHASIKIGIDTEHLGIGTDVKLLGIESFADVKRHLLSFLWSSEKSKASVGVCNSATFVEAFEFGSLNCSAEESIIGLTPSVGHTNGTSLSSDVISTKSVSPLLCHFLAHEWAPCPPLPHFMQICKPLKQLCPHRA